MDENNQNNEEVKTTYLVIKVVKVIIENWKIATPLVVGIWYALTFGYKVIQNESRFPMIEKICYQDSIEIRALKTRIETDSLEYLDQQEK